MVRDLFVVTLLANVAQGILLDIKNVIVRSTEEAAYEAAYNAFNEKYSRIRFGDENGISYL